MLKKVGHNSEATQKQTCYCESIQYLIRTKNKNIEICGTKKVKRTHIDKMEKQLKNINTQ